MSEMRSNGFYIKTFHLKTVIAVKGIEVIHITGNDTCF